MLRELVAAALVWYAARPALRALVRHLPFGTGHALDVALIVGRDLAIPGARRAITRSRT
jgi:hypothetical protein